MPAVVAAGTGIAVGKDAALQVFAKRLLNKPGWGVLVAVAVELTCAGKLKPGLAVLGHRAVQQVVLGVARVVELGFGR